MAMREMSDNGSQAEALRDRLDGVTKQGGRQINVDRELLPRLSPIEREVYRFAIRGGVSIRKTADAVNVHHTQITRLRETITRVANAVIELIHSTTIEAVIEQLPDWSEEITALWWRRPHPRAKRCCRAIYYAESTTNQKDVVAFAAYLKAVRVPGPIIVPKIIETQNENTQEKAA